MTTLGDLARQGLLEFGDGYRTRRDQLSDNGYRIIRAGDVHAGGLSATGPDFVSKRYSLAIGTKAAREGDVVLTTKGTVGRVASVRSLTEGLVYSPQVCYFRTTNETVLGRAYLRYWLQSPEFRSQMSYLQAATDMAPYISLRDLSNAHITIPEAPLQQAIAGLLGALDEKIAANHRLATSALALASTLFEAQPTPTRQDRYDDVALIGGGGTPSTKNEAFWNGTIPWVTPTDVTALTLPYLVGTSRRITDAGLAACSSALYSGNSILMTSRATIGAFAIAKVPVAVNQGFIVVRPKDERYFMWLFHEMQSRVADYLSHANGATFLELSRGRFKELPVRWPSIDSAASFSARVTPLHDRAVQVSQENPRLETLRDTLLPHLMSGRLSIRQATATVEEVL